MKDYIIVSFSGGKDSTAMLLRMLETGERIDEVICCDTYMEYPAMYRHIEKIKALVEKAGVKFTELRSEKSFEYYLFEHVPKRRAAVYEKQQVGYSWPGPRTRWCTSRLKLDVINKYFKALEKQYNLIHCVGIAFDEMYRLDRPNNQAKGQRHPLVKWQWTEEDCLQYCYKRGFDWEGLYEIFRKEEGRSPRVACWCCPLQSLEDLRILRKQFPDLWARLMEMGERTWRTFRPGYFTQDLEKRFDLEDELTERGYSVTNRAFHSDLKKLLAGESSIPEIIEERERQMRIPN